LVPPINMTQPPLISVIVLNYNGAPWLGRCLGSLKTQTIFPRLEIVVADNASPDKSDLLAAELMKNWPNGRVIQHGVNLGYCEGNNRAAERASGKYLFFLNNDTWMEPDCLEQLVKIVEEKGAQAGEPLIIDYERSDVLCPVGEGFDIFGMLSLGNPGQVTREVFVVGGCSYLIQSDLFRRLGGFDTQFYMYADEYDLSWRVWASGGKAILATSSRLHHRGAANVNPEGGGRTVEQRTSDTKRFYANRNGLLLLLKNCQHLLLLMVPLQIGLLAFEAGLGLVLVRRWSFVKRAYVDSIAACWKLRRYVFAERRRLKQLRRRSDWQMLRFLRWRLNRWDEFLNLRRHGPPKVSPG
jgi:GT2 family glycosyltransferase